MVSLWKFYNELLYDSFLSESHALNHQASEQDDTYFSKFIRVENMPIIKTK